MRLLEKALFTLGGLVSGGLLALNTACAPSYPTPMPVQYKTPTPHIQVEEIPIIYPTPDLKDWHTPLPVLTPGFMPTIQSSSNTPTPSPTPVYQGIKEVNIENLINNLFAYYNVGKRDDLVRKINTFEISISQNPRQVAEEFQTKLVQLISAYYELKPRLGPFGVDKLGKDCTDSRMDISLEPDRNKLEATLKEIQQSIESSIKYDDASLIKWDKLKMPVREFVVLEGEYDLGYGDYVTPSACIIQQHLSSYIGNVYYKIRPTEWGLPLSYVIEMNNGGVAKIAGGSNIFAGSGTRTPPVNIRKDTKTTRVLPNVSRDLPKIPFKLPDSYANISLDFVRSPDFGIMILDYSNDKKANEVWNSDISSGDIKTDGKDCIKSICVYKIFWKREKGGNYYAYGEQVGKYIVILGLSNSIDIWNRTPPTDAVNDPAYGFDQKLQYLLSILAK